MKTASPKRKTSPAATAKEVPPHGALDDLAAMMKTTPGMHVSNINHYATSGMYSVSLQDRATGRFYFGKDNSLDKAISGAVSEVRNQKS